MAAPTVTVLSPPPATYPAPGILRPGAYVKWTGGTAPFDVLHEWDTVNTFDSGALIQDSNIGVTSPDVGIPPGDMGPAGTTWYYRVTVTDSIPLATTTAAKTLDWYDPVTKRRYLYHLANVGVNFAPRHAILDGTPGVYASTEDVNILDANTAHIQQGLGSWYAGSGFAIATQDAAHKLFGDFAAKHVTNLDTGPAAYFETRRSAGSRFAIAPSTEYSFACDIYPETASRKGNILFIWYNSAGTIIGTAEPSLTAHTQNAWNTKTHTATSPATAVAVSILVRYQVDGAGNLAIGENLWVDRACLRLGADATFVPSLRIAGTLDETIDPVGMPIVFAGDGTPLTIGDGWAGDAYSYVRRDGVGGPVVAHFDAQGFALTDGDLDTWVDEVGNVWTLHGAVTIADGPDGNPTTLRRYLYHLANVGVGFYPTDTAVLAEAVDGDVREFDRFLYHLANIDATTPTPHIWFLYPTYGREGWEFAIVGFGFGDTQATFAGIAELNGLAVGVTSWTLVAAVGTGMEIDPAANLANPVHQLILAVVPVGAESGLVIVTTDGP